jgi:hypothetical protein
MVGMTMKAFEKEKLNRSDEGEKGDDNMACAQRGGT